MEDQLQQQVIWLHTAAPDKPSPGQPCNGCGVCCLAEPCPVARVFLWQSMGACRALLWLGPERQYRCGLLLMPSTYLPLLPRAWQPWFRRVLRRWIAAGTACDSDSDVTVM
jgi:hypothetical protein